ncbi:NADP-dependent oxidoreductase domain-containing protein [Dichotomopilus funicola]|uniref:NADP-dependent oxidoreductase domain-containing protein n=1 Tax=Dichotomopilus funicola TaxID=1934379 RepID=A0AAN6UY79_9PEZI|nr:NADP-dependent oxidoreductase domain-containing protein [Dichotomopilus funicola]
MAPLNINSTFKLPSGYLMPRLGFGVYQTPPKETARCVTEAFAAGYRHVDSAAAYRNEAPCGEAIRAASPSIPRDQIFFTSKIPPQKMGYQATASQVDESLAKSGLDYIDLILIHAPFGGSAQRKGSWKALVEAVEAGKVRSIGVSNYGVHHLDELERHIAELEEERGGKGKGGVVSVGQWEIHPFCRRQDIIDWCTQRGVVVQAYCPLVQGERWGEPGLKKLAAKYGKSEAQVLIRWSLDKGLVPLPKSVTPARIVENADVFDFELSEEEVAGLETGEYTPCTWDPTVSPLDE